MRTKACLLTACAIAVGLATAGSVRAADGGDDSYTFAAGKSEERAVTLERAADAVSLTWSQPSSASWDTALLGVRVSAKDAEPWVEIAAGSARVQEYLDPGASGVRWLNLTGLRDQLAGGARVVIAGHAATIEAGVATLRVFANRLDLRAPMLILAPHPDDAEIAAFGLYAGSNATIVTVTCGNAGDANYADNIQDPAQP